MKSVLGRPTWLAKVGVYVVSLCFRVWDVGEPYFFGILDYSKGTVLSSGLHSLTDERSTTGLAITRLNVTLIRATPSRTTKPQATRSVWR